MQALLGRSRAIREIRSQIVRFAKATCDVLITGETGTGKELVANLIHGASPRADQPMVPLNCGEFTNELVESELFGFEPGAFTGAQTRRIGLLQSANRGTVFLDEIGEMSLPTQVKLLRVLETRQVRRLGSNRPEPIDVRIIAATNRNVEALIEEGQFRRDFYHRIRVGRIHVPPLCERPEDIPVLVEHFMKELSQASARPVPVLSADVGKAFLDSAWPGNVRELRNELAGAFALATGNTIEWSDLSNEFRQAPSLASGSLPEAGEAGRLREALERNYWNVSLTAESLGMSRSSLYRKLDNHRIEVPRDRRRGRGSGS